MMLHSHYLVALCLILLVYNVVAIELQVETFVETVVDSDKVWIVEFYSSMCGSCQEFAPIWKKVKGSFPKVEYGEINIDRKPGMELAQRLGALEEGIPLVRVFKEKANGKGTTLPLSESESASGKKVLSKLKSSLKGFVPHEDGKLRKT